MVWIVAAAAVVVAGWWLGGRRHTDRGSYLSESELRRRQSRGWSDASTVKNEHN